MFETKEGMGFKHSPLGDWVWESSGFIAMVFSDRTFLYLILKEVGVGSGSLSAKQTVFLAF